MYMTLKFPLLYSTLPYLLYCLGEYLALAVSLEHYYHVTHNQRALTLSKTLNLAIERLLQNRKSPGRKVHLMISR